MLRRQLLRAHQSYNPSTSHSIAQMLKRYIIAKPKHERDTERFIKEVFDLLWNLHQYNSRVAREKKEYPRNKEFDQLLIRYIELEHEVLYKYTNTVGKYAQDFVERRITRLLHAIFYEVVIHDENNVTNIDIIVKKLMLRLLVDVKYLVKDKIVFNMARRLLMEIDGEGRMMELNELPGYVKVHFAVSKNLVTSDYGTDDSDNDTNEVSRSSSHHNERNSNDVSTKQPSDEIRFTPMETSIIFTTKNTTSSSDDIKSTSSSNNSTSKSSSTSFQDNHLTQRNKFNNHSTSVSLETTSSIKKSSPSHINNNINNNNNNNNRNNGDKTLPNKKLTPKKKVNPVVTFEILDSDEDEDTNSYMIYIQKEVVPSPPPPVKPKKKLPKKVPEIATITLSDSDDDDDEITFTNLTNTNNSNNNNNNVIDSRIELKEENYDKNTNSETDIRNINNSNCEISSTVITSEEDKLLLKEESCNISKNDEIWDIKEKPPNIEVIPQTHSEGVASISEALQEIERELTNIAELNKNQDDASNIVKQEQNSSQSSIDSGPLPIDQVKMEMEDEMNLISEMLRSSSPILDNMIKIKDELIVRSSQEQAQNDVDVITNIINTSDDILSSTDINEVDEQLSKKSLHTQSLGIDQNENFKISSSSSSLNNKSNENDFLERIVPNVFTRNELPMNNCELNNSPSNLSHEENLAVPNSDVCDKRFAVSFLEMKTLINDFINFEKNSYDTNYVKQLILPTIDSDRFVDDTPETLISCFNSVDWINPNLVLPVVNSSLPSTVSATKAITNDTYTDDSRLTDSFLEEILDTSYLYCKDFKDLECFLFDNTERHSFGQYCEQIAINDVVSGMQDVVDDSELNINFSNLLNTVNDDENICLDNKRRLESSSLDDINCNRKRKCNKIKVNCDKPLDRRKKNRNSR